MQVNIGVWGRQDQWTLATELSNSAWEDTDLFFYHGSYDTLGAMREQNLVEYDTAIDDSICYAAHAAAEKMPLADIEVFDYTGSSVGQLNENCGFFLSTCTAVSSTDWSTYQLVSKMGDASAIGTLSGAYRWAPTGIPSSATYPRPTNKHQYLRPIVQFAPKSMFGVIMCCLVKNDYKATVTLTLKSLIDNQGTYIAEYHIEKVYLRMYGYKGRSTLHGNFNDFGRLSPSYFGTSIDHSIHFSTGYLLSYYQSVGVVGSINIAGAMDDITNQGTSSNKDFGATLEKYHTDSGGASERYGAVLSRHLVSDVRVTRIGTTNKYSLHPIIDIISSNFEEFRKGAAAYGLFFADDTYDLLTDTTNTNRWIDNEMCLGLLDENGLGHGEYTRGIYNITNPIFNYDNSQDSPYNPQRNIDTNTYSNTTGFNSLSGGATATIKYVLDSSNVRQLLTDLWTISHNIAGADYEKYDYKILDSFLVSNPIDSIVSIKRFPFEIPHTFSTQKTNVCLGKNTGNAQGYVTHNVFNSVVFSGVQIFPKFGNSFLDYAPYTEYELYIPFCGTVKLNAGDILGHTLNCRLQIDLTTGACVAYIMADDLVIETASGVVSCELQVAGTDSATVDSNIQNAVLNHIGARTNKEIAMLSPLTFGGLLSAVSNPVKTSGAMENANTEISRADYNLTHIQTPVHSMGNAGGLTGWIQEFNARLIIYYPEGEAIDSSAPVSSTSPHLADLTAYAHNVGFACVMNGTVSEFHGKTVGNIDTSSIVGATEEERAQIKALFAQGVWLP